MINYLIIYLLILFMFAIFTMRTLIETLDEKEQNDITLINKIKYFIIGALLWIPFPLYFIIFTATTIFLLGTILVLIIPLSAVCVVIIAIGQVLGEKDVDGGCHGDL